MANVFVEQVELYRLSRDDTRSQLYVPSKFEPQNPENLQEAEIPRRDWIYDPSLCSYRFPVWRIQG
jgi:hypothetical protein